ncbi:MAG: sulfatase [Candidatus Omnitrophica bacterium]|nr:sulfatase [Candidatus Omnitrophota bacterium]
MKNILDLKIHKNYKMLIVLLFFLTVAIFYSKQKTISYPDVILITVDALRADHLSCYGYPRQTSPNIDNLAKLGVTFLNCFATSSGTVQSSVGLLTGRYLQTDKIGSDWNNALDGKFTTLAEYLKHFGYYTIAVLTNGTYRRGRGFEQGFDYFHVNNITNDKDAEKLTAMVVDLLNKNQGKKPLFIWAHYIEPHAPYYFRQEYFKTFQGDRLYKDNDKILKLKPEDLDKGFWYKDWTSKGYIPPVVFHRDNYSLNYYIACYDTEILYVDYCIGNLLKNLNNDTVIILTADHGESLGEHNVYFSHGENIYDEVLHIPLIIKDNRCFKGGKLIKEVVSSIDIVPTILNRVNPFWYFLNKVKFDGIDLRTVILNKNVLRKYIYSYLHWLGISIRDVNKNIKYILHKNGKEELYVLPDEDNNLIYDIKMSRIKQRLKKELMLWSRKYPIPSDINAYKRILDKDIENNLKNLGYLH